ncbi:hypothetical protein IJS77_01035 [bacterium]|nr:hypothetical protein [bacterium]
MRIGNLNTNVNFKQIKMDGDSYWDLRNTSSEEAVDSIKDMSLKGFNLGYITCNDSGLFLRGIQSREGKS